MSAVSGRARGGHAPWPAAASLARTTRTRLRADRLASRFVTAGGLVIIASIIGILAFILIEVWPLLRRAEVKATRPLALSGPPLRALLADEHRRYVAGIDASGALRIIDSSSGALALSRPLAPGNAPVEIVDAKSHPSEGLITAATDTGDVLMVRVHWDVSFEGRKRITTPRVEEAIVTRVDPSGAPAVPYAARRAPGGGGTIAAQRSDGTLLLIRREEEENFLTGETRVSISREEHPVGTPLSRLALDAAQRFLYAGTPDGRLLAWPVQRQGLGRPEEADAGGAAVTSLDLLIGDRALVVGQADGSLSVWFRVPREEGGFRLARIRDFPPHGAPVVAVAPSLRNKGFLALDQAGGLGLYYSTSHRTLWTGRPGAAAPADVAFAPKSDGAYVSGPASLEAWDIHNPHPEVSLRSLFGSVWYEGYRKPELVWQSSSGADDFEPKLSLTPLLVGTLKGTLYSLILAIPLARLSAAPLVLAWSRHR
ncbi:MAG: hypothetical protein ACE5FC_05985 [Myxococcota bacterium]